MISTGEEQGWVRPEILVVTCIPLQNWCSPNLSAPYWRFYWNDRPGARMRFSGRTFDLTPQECFLIPPGTAYSASLSGRPYHLNCNFIFPDAGAELPAGIYPLPLPQGLVPIAQRCAAAAAALPEELAFPAPHFASPEERRLALEISLQALVLFGLGSLPLQPARADTGDPRVNMVLRKIRAELEAGRGAGLDTESLSALAGMHRNSLARIFRRFVGMSPCEFLRKQRIDYACILLHRQAWSIAEIAARLGYCDRYHFTREFTQAKGVPPAAFRRNIP